MQGLGRKGLLTLTLGLAALVQAARPTAAAPPSAAVSLGRPVASPVTLDRPRAVGDVRAVGHADGDGERPVVRAAMPDHQPMPHGPGPCLPGPVISPPPAPPGPVYSKPFAAGPAIGPTFPGGACCDQGCANGGPVFCDRFGCGDGVTQCFNNLFYFNAD